MFVPASGGPINSHVSDHPHSHHYHQGHSHGHSHSHSPAGSNLRFAFFLNLFFALIELAGGIWTNSVAVSSNALHDFGDSFALGLSWYLERVALRERNTRYSYGYRRFSPLGALIHALVLVTGSAIILSQALPRLWAPKPIHVEGMVGFAFVGIVINLAAAIRLSRGGSLNESVARWHLIEDVMGWLAVLVIAIVMTFVNFPILDPLLSILITVWVLWNVIQRFRETLRVFLQAVPAQVDVTKLEHEIRSVEHVLNVHHMHLWSLDGESHILTTHVVIPSMITREQSFDVKNRIKDSLRPYAIRDVTIELEYDSEDCPTKECK